MLKLIKKALNSIMLPLVLALCLVSSILMPFNTSYAEETNIRKVRVGVCALPSYFEKDAFGNYVGYGYEILQKLKLYNNWEYEYVYYGDNYVNALNGLDIGEIDILSPAVRNQKNLEKYRFSDKPIGNQSTILTIMQGPSRIEPGDYESYNGMTIGMLIGSSCNDGFETFAKTKGFFYEPLYFDSEDAISSALKKGLIDGRVSYSLRGHNNEAILDIFDTQSFYLITRNDDIELMEEANNSINKLYTNNPSWSDNLYYKYYKIEGNGSINLSNHEIAYLKTHTEEGKKLKVLFPPDHKPYAYYKDGKLQGASVRFFDNLAKKLGLIYEILPVTSVKEYNLAIQNREADILGTMLESASYAEGIGYVCTDNYVDVHLVLLKNSKSSKVKKLAVNRNVVTQKQYAQEQYDNGISLLEYDTNDQCIEAVKSGKADICLTNIYEANVAILQDYSHIFEMQILPKRLGISTAVSLANDRILVSILSKGINSYTEEEVTQFMRQSMNELKTDKTIENLYYENPLMFASFIALVVSMLGSCFYGLKRRQYTKELQGKNSELEAQLEQIKSLNDQLETSKDEADAANKAKSAFLFNMSHDIRTPMNAIVGFSDLLKKNIDDKERSLDYVDKINESSEFLLSLINNVLEMARIESGKYILDEGIHDIYSLREQIVATFATQMENKGLDFTVDYDVKHRYIYGDNIKIQEICLNLLSNSYKYTPKGGKVSFKVEELPSAKEDHSCFKTTVADTGIGMSEEFLPHLFDEFERERSTTQGKVAGTGLGMAIVKKMVDLMNGTIEVASKLGEGTTFVVTVEHRIADEALVKREAIEDKVEISNLRGKRILLAEDNELNAEIATALLEEAGFVVEHAEDGIICVDMLVKAESGYYDGIIMDIQMPNMDGYYAARKIRNLEDKAKASIPIIAMTANAFEEDRKKAFEAGMNEHVSKPVDTAVLMKVLGKVLK